MFQKNAKHQVNAGNRYTYVHHLLKYLDISRSAIPCRPHEPAIAWHRCNFSSCPWQWLLGKGIGGIQRRNLAPDTSLHLNPNTSIHSIPFLKKCKSINTLLHKCQALAMTFISWQGVMCLTGWVSQAYNCYNAVPSDIWQFYSIVFGDKIHKMFSIKKHIESRNKHNTQQWKI